MIQPFPISSKARRTDKYIRYVSISKKLKQCLNLPSLVIDNLSLQFYNWDEKGHMKACTSSSIPHFLG